MGSRLVTLGDFRFELVRLSPERAERYIRPGDFTHEIPLREGRGLAAFKQLPFRGDGGSHWLRIYTPDAMSQGEPPADMYHGPYEGRSAHLVFRKENFVDGKGLARERFSLALTPAEGVPRNLDREARAVELLARGTRFLLPEGESIASVAVGDVNADGKTDVLVSLTDGGAFVFQQTLNLQGISLCAPTYCEILWHSR